MKILNNFERPDLLKDWIEIDFVIDPRGRVIKWSRFFDINKFDVDENYRVLYGDDIESTRVFSIHNDICRKICENLGYKECSDHKDLCRKLGYLLIGGISGEFYIDIEDLTQAQLNTLDRLDLIKY